MYSWTLRTSKLRRRLEIDADYFSHKTSRKLRARCTMPRSHSTSSIPTHYHIRLSSCLLGARPPHRNSPQAGSGSPRMPMHQGTLRNCAPSGAFPGYRSHTVVSHRCRLPQGDLGILASNRGRVLGARQVRPTILRAPLPHMQKLP